MARKNTRTFKAKVVRTKLKASTLIDGDDVIIGDAAILVTLELPATKTGVHLKNWFEDAKQQKQIEVRVESAQFALAEP